MADNTDSSSDPKLAVDDLWRDSFASELDSITGDLVLDRLLNDCDGLMAKLDQTSENEEWQQHYKVALTLCRLSRTVRFHIAKCLELIAPESRGSVLEKLQTAAGSIVEMAAVPAGELDIEFDKDLDQIKENIEHRRSSIENLFYEPAT